MLPRLCAPKKLPKTRNVFSNYLNYVKYNIHDNGEFYWIC